MASQLTRGSRGRVACDAMTTTDAGAPGSDTHRFESVQSVRDALRDVNYLADDGIAGVAMVVFALDSSCLAVSLRTASYASRSLVGLS